MEMKKVFVFLAALLFTWTGSFEAQDNQLTAKEKKAGCCYLIERIWMDGLLSGKMSRLHSVGRLKTE